MEPNKTVKKNKPSGGPGLSATSESRPIGRRAVAVAAVGGALAAGALVLRWKKGLTDDAAVADGCPRMPEIVVYLQENLGKKVTAYLSGVDDVRTVGRWAKGKSRPKDLAGQRLLLAFEATRCLVEAYGSKAARTWFFGMNPLLDDEAPAYVLREGRHPEDWGLVISAAREFVES